jgi:hypothetical protein
MKYKLAVCCSLILVLFSCTRIKNALLKTGRGTERSHFKHTKGWIFYDTPVTEASESLSSWNEWRILANWHKKPKKRLRFSAKNQKH